MQRKRKSKIILVLLIVLLIVTGCKKEDTDALKFKREFEQYNDTLSKVNIDEDNPFIITNDVYSLVENEKAFVVLYGNAKNEETRNIVEDVISVAKKSNLKKVYFVSVNEEDTIEFGGHKIENMPSLVSVIRKEVSLIVNDKDSINLVIDPVVQELSSCDIDVGC